MATGVVIWSTAIWASFPDDSSSICLPLANSFIFNLRTCDVQFQYLLLTAPGVVVAVTIAIETFLYRQHWCVGRHSRPSTRFPLFRWCEQTFTWRRHRTRNCSLFRARLHLAMKKIKSFPCPVLCTADFVYPQLIKDFNSRTLPIYSPTHISLFTTTSTLLVQPCYLIASFYNYFSLSFGIVLMIPCAVTRRDGESPLGLPSIFHPPILMKDLCFLRDETLTKFVVTPSLIIITIYQSFSQIGAQAQDWISLTRSPTI